MAMASPHYYPTYQNLLYLPYLYVLVVPDMAVHVMVFVNQVVQIQVVKIQVLNYHLFKIQVDQIQVNGIHVLLVVAIVVS